MEAASIATTFHLDSRFCEADSQRQLFAHEDVWIVRLAESSFQFAELSRRKARTMSLLFDRLAGGRRAARRQRQRALVLVLSRRHVIGRRRRRPLVLGLGRPRALQRVLRCGADRDAARHVGLGKFAVLAQMETVVIVVVTTAAGVIRGEISLTVLVMIIQKHRGVSRA